MITNVLVKGRDCSAGALRRLPGRESISMGLEGGCSWGGAGLSRWGRSLVKDQNVRHSDLKKLLGDTWQEHMVVF